MNYETDLKELDRKLQAKTLEQQQFVASVNTRIGELGAAVRQLYENAGIAEDVDTLTRERQRLLQEGEKAGNDLGQEIVELQSVRRYLVERIGSPGTVPPEAPPAPPEPLKEPVSLDAPAAPEPPSDSAQRVLDGPAPPAPPKPSVPEPDAIKEERRI
jgi:hypothetical protein